MFGLFDPPRIKIRKRLPVNAHPWFDDFLSTLNVYLTIQGGAFFSPNDKECAIGTIMSVWACNTCMSGKFQLSDFNYRYVQNMGLNCHRMLAPANKEIVTGMVSNLIESGRIPKDIVK